MNRNLNPQEFGEQLSLFDAHGLTRHGPERPADTYEVAEDYPDPHLDDQDLPDPNPLYTDEPDGIDYSRMGDAVPGWVPTFDVSSVQTKINNQAVEHLATHASGLGEGDVIAVKGGGHHTIFDGNHRLNAAQRRGQLFVPGLVYDTD